MAIDYMICWVCCFSLWKQDDLGLSGNGVLFPRRYFSRLKSRYVWTNPHPFQSYWSWFIKPRTISIYLTCIKRFFEVFLALAYVIYVLADIRWVSPGIWQFDSQQSILNCVAGKIHREFQGNPDLWFTSWVSLTTCHRKLATSTI